jgi:hypothetical protein
VNEEMTPPEAGTPPRGAIWRSFVVAVFVFVFSIVWPVSGVLILTKLLVVGVLIVLAYLALGEFSAEEMALGRSLLKMRLIPAQHPNES